MHEKQDFKAKTSVKIEIERKEIFLGVSFGTEESAQAAIGEINKTEPHTAKKLGQNNWENMPRAKSTKK